MLTQTIFFKFENGQKFLMVKKKLQKRTFQMFNLFQKLQVIKIKSSQNLQDTETSNDTKVFLGW